MPPLEAQLQQQLAHIQSEKIGSYTVRTEHLNKDGSPKYTNRLIREDSPYLLQHAHNPVNWYPWGEAAFALAKRENKPVFLSIGYSTCHWCHVMEVESFDDESIAAFLNKHFVSIKVDREQRPDLDNIYMTGVQIFIGRGGWPMSNFLTPDGKPFYGGTYFPPQQFIQLLSRVSSVWQQDEQKLRDDADKVTKQIALYTARSTQAATLDQSVIDSSVKEIYNRWDKIYGGFSPAPKFPNETLLLLLLDQLRRHDDPATLEALEHTLHQMAQGGIYDQVAGGFHRYSTDTHWLVPHFEKMLYNQALLGRVYAEAYQLTGNLFYKRICQEILDYVLRDMRGPQGGFYSATDADNSEGEEGVFFLWHVEELRHALNKEDAELAIKLYGVTETGNFEKRNILFLANSLEQYAQQEPLDYQQLLGRLLKIKQQLYHAREKREHPLRDEKIISAWNAMMITTLARSAKLINEPQYLPPAIDAANYLWREHVDPKDYKLWRVSLNGKPSINATQEDYAYFAEALISLFDVTGDHRWLQHSRKMTDKMIKDYSDSNAGGFFSSGEDDNGPLIARIKDSADGAIPSGNSVALHVLVQLSQRTGELNYQQFAEAAMAGFSGQIKQQATGYTYMLTAVTNYLQGESRQKQFLADGNVSAEFSLKPSKLKSNGEQQLTFVLDLNIKKGWHINADKPLQKQLIATSVELADKSPWQMTTIEFPPAQALALSFQKEPLLLYQGQVQISGSLTAQARHSLIRFSLQLQACDEQHCLTPEKRAFIVAAP